MDGKKKDSRCWIKYNIGKGKIIYKAIWKSYGVIYRAICFVLSWRECVFILVDPDP